MTVTRRAMARFRKPRRFVHERLLFVTDLPSTEWIQLVDDLCAVADAAEQQAAFHPDSVSPRLADALEKMRPLEGEPR